jgi:hypothetical protein
MTAENDSVLRPRPGRPDRIIPFLTDELTGGRHD